MDSTCPREVFWATLWKETQERVRGTAAVRMELLSLKTAWEIGFGAMQFSLGPAEVNLERRVMLLCNHEHPLF